MLIFQAARITTTIDLHFHNLRQDGNSHAPCWGTSETRARQPCMRSVSTPQSTLPAVPRFFVDHMHTLHEDRSKLPVCCTTKAETEEEDRHKSCGAGARGESHAFFVEQEWSKCLRIQECGRRHGRRVVQESECNELQWIRTGRNEQHKRVVSGQVQATQ